MESRISEGCSNVPSCSSAMDTEVEQVAKQVEEKASGRGKRQQKPRKMFEAGKDGSPSTSKATGAKQIDQAPGALQGSTKLITRDSSYLRNLSYLSLHPEAPQQWKSHFEALRVLVSKEEMMLKKEERKTRWMRQTRKTMMTEAMWEEMVSIAELLVKRAHRDLAFCNYEALVESILLIENLSFRKKMRKVLTTIHPFTMDKSRKIETSDHLPMVLLDIGEQQLAELAYRNLVLEEQFENLEKIKIVKLLMEEEKKIPINYELVGNQTGEWKKMAVNGTPRHVWVDARGSIFFNPPIVGRPARCVFATTSFDRSKLPALYSIPELRLPVFRKHDVLSEWNQWEEAIKEQYVEQTCVECKGSVGQFGVLRRTDVCLHCLPNTEKWRFFKEVRSTIHSVVVDLESEEKVIMEKEQKAQKRNALDLVDLAKRVHQRKAEDGTVPSGPLNLDELNWLNKPASPPSIADHSEQNDVEIGAEEPEVAVEAVEAVEAVARPELEEENSEVIVDGDSGDEQKDVERRAEEFEAAVARPELAEEENLEVIVDGDFGEKQREAEHEEEDDEAAMEAVARPELVEEAPGVIVDGDSGEEPRDAENGAEEYEVAVEAVTRPELEEEAPGVIVDGDSEEKQNGEGPVVEKESTNLEGEKDGDDDIVDVIDQEADDDMELLRLPNNNADEIVEDEERVDENDCNGNMEGPVPEDDDNEAENAEEELVEERERVDKNEIADSIDENNARIIEDEAGKDLGSVEPPKKYVVEKNEAPDTSRKEQKEERKTKVVAAPRASPPPKKRTAEKLLFDLEDFVEPPQKKSDFFDFSRERDYLRTPPLLNWPEEDAFGGAVEKKECKKAEAVERRMADAAGVGPCVARNDIEEELIIPRQYRIDCDPEEYLDPEQRSEPLDVIELFAHQDIESMLDCLNPAPSTRGHEEARIPSLPSQSSKSPSSLSRVERTQSNSSSEPSRIQSVLSQTPPQMAPQAPLGSGRPTPMDQFGFEGQFPSTSNNRYPGMAPWNGFQNFPPQHFWYPGHQFLPAGWYQPPPAHPSWQFHPQPFMHPVPPQPAQPFHQPPHQPLPALPLMPPAPQFPPHQL